MKFLKKMKKNQKGFTLVEIIVVLVILAILAAFTIPTMLGFVNEAKGKAYIAEAREVYVAAQATATEYKANGKGVTAADLGAASVSTAGINAATASGTMKRYLSPDMGIAASEETADKDKAFWSVTLEMETGTPPTPTGKVKSVVYKKDGYTVTLAAGGSTTVVKDS